MLMQYPQEVSCYDVFDLVIQGPQAGNPFLEVNLSAQFRHSQTNLVVEGFYDGDGVYRIRCMPDQPGSWNFTTFSNCAELNGLHGTFICAHPRPDVHGPVRVRDRFHFAYDDGTPYFQVGTTCYAWVHQGAKLEEQTLQTLRSAPFNKLRMCVFPKHYTYNQNEPELFAFERLDTGGWDFTHFNPLFFRHLEQRVADLGELGIEADIILFHPYDRWGFSAMGAEADDRYLRYIVARLGAHRNVWWSLANEYDLLKNRSMMDWDRYFQILQKYDASQHLRSVHNWQGLDTHDANTFYNFSKPWVTHCSIQHSYLDLVSEWREKYQKPVVVDECCYEGNLPNGWGNITPQEMVRRFWEGTVRGGYVGHGETYLDPGEVIWWSKGGRLHGQSPARIQFLKQIMAEVPGMQIDPLGEITNTHLLSAGQPGMIYFTYFGIRQPGEVTFNLADDTLYTIDLIDTWEMTITRLPGSFCETATVKLPGKPYLALRLLKAS